MDTLQTVIDLLNHDYLRTQIDDPIDYALLTFQYDSPEAITHRRFNQIIASYIIHMYQMALSFKEQVPFEKAFEEAVWILENGYKSDHTEGYDGALLDAVDTERGINYVLEKMNEVIKNREQDKYISWVFEKHIDPTDWQLHVQLTEKILSNINAEFSPSPIEFSSLQFARHYIDLIKMYFLYKKEVSTSLDM